MSGVSSKAITRSQRTTKSPQHQQRQQHQQHYSTELHSRRDTAIPYSEQWYGNEEVSKRARGDQVTGAARRRSLGASEMGSGDHNRAIQSSTCYDSPASAVESIYSLSSPRMPLRETAGQRASPTAREEEEEENRGSACALFFGEEEEVCTRTRFGSGVFFSCRQKSRPSQASIVCSFCTLFVLFFFFLDHR